LLTPIRTGRFKKEFALAEKRGKWKGTLECHVEPDWLLIYEIDKSTGEVTFHRTGTHSDLF